MPGSGQPLTDAEFDELDQFLMSDATPGECMDISMMDGFISALPIGPNMMMPSQRLPVLRGETNDESTFRSTIGTVNQRRELCH